MNSLFHIAGNEYNKKTGSIGVVGESDGRRKTRNAGKIVPTESIEIRLLNIFKHEIIK